MKQSDSGFTARSETQTIAAAKDMLAVVNSAARQGRAQFITFILFCSYELILLGATEDSDFLTALRLPIPLLQVELPVAGVYSVAPFLLLLLHANLLLQLVFLARNLRHLDKAVLQLRSNTIQEQYRDAADPFLFVQALIGKQLPMSIRFLLQSLLWIMVFVGPMGLILAFQLRYLPAHDISITAWHRCLVLTDAICGIYAIALIRKITSGTPGILFLGQCCAAGFVIALISLLIATLPGERMELRVLEGVISRVFGPDIINSTTQWRYDQDIPRARQELQELEGSFLHRNLNLAGATLVKAAPSDTIIASYIQKGRSADAARRDQSVGIDLSGRDLRFANFRGARMPRAILRGANLTGANLSRANLEDADFTGATLIATQLGGAKMEHGDFSGADMTGANLYQSSLVGARLVETQLIATIVVETDLRASYLGLANFDGALIVNSTFYGAFAGLASFRGATVEKSIFSGATLYKAHLGGINWHGSGNDANITYYTTMLDVDFAAAPSASWDAARAKIASQLSRKLLASEYVQKVFDKIVRAGQRKNAEMTSTDGQETILVNQATIESATNASAKTFPMREPSSADRKVMIDEQLEMLAKARCGSSDERRGIELRVKADRILGDDKFAKVAERVPCE